MVSTVMLRMAMVAERMIIVVIGVSGSGKSSLAFDTACAEGLEMVSVAVVDAELFARFHAKLMINQSGMGNQELTQDGDFLPLRSGFARPTVTGSLCIEGYGVVKFTKYFQTIRIRPDRTIIKDEWIRRVIDSPQREYIQADGRIRRWAEIEENEGRYLRVVLLTDGETIHNAFFDRGYKP